MDDLLESERSMSGASQTVEDLIRTMSCLDTMVRSQSGIFHNYCQDFSISFAFEWFVLLSVH